MKEAITFYGFRGCIIFPKQVTLYNLGLENNPTDKNKVFVNFFEELEKVGKVDSKYQKRKYYLFFRKKYNSIIQCQLARERISNKYKMTERKIIGTKDQDFPYVNIFVELKSQKFLIESKTTVFDDYNTCSNVIKNIMNKYLRKMDSEIDINPIIEEQEFWKIFDENEVKKLSFNLSVPNLFDASDDATNFLKDARDNIGARNVSLTFSNSDENLNPNKNGIESFVKYANGGGGTWNIRYKNKTRYF